MNLFKVVQSISTWAYSVDQYTYGFHRVDSFLHEFYQLSDPWILPEFEFVKQ